MGEINLERIDQLKSVELDQLCARNPREWWRQVKPTILAKGLALGMSRAEIKSRMRLYVEKHRDKTPL